MGDTASLQLVLEVPRSGEPIRGTVEGPGEARAFSGWVEFSCALRDLGAWRATSVRLTLEPAAGRASPSDAADSDAVASWLAVAAALQALSCVRAGDAGGYVDPPGRSH